MITMAPVFLLIGTWPRNKSGSCFLAMLKCLKRPQLKRPRTFDYALEANEA